MKRFLFLLSAFTVSLAIAAQMQVWSNGTIIFSHDQSEVDSISFGSPMKVRTQFNASTATSLAGMVYIDALSKKHDSYDLIYLFFLDGTSGYAFCPDILSPNFVNKNFEGKSSNRSMKVVDFSYVINGNDIILSTGTRQIEGKMIGKNALFFKEFRYDTEVKKYLPDAFIAVDL